MRNIFLLTVLVLLCCGSGEHKKAWEPPPDYYRCGVVRVIKGVDKCVCCQLTYCYITGEPSERRCVKK